MFRVILCYPKAGRCVKAATCRLHDQHHSFPTSRASKWLRTYYCRSPAGESQLIYQWQEGAEILEGYQPGGYHPVHMRDEFKEKRYTVVHKLRSGSYSTVWLAKDHLTKEYVGLKIVVASASNESRESHILRAIGALSEGQSHHPGRKCVSSLKDEFFIDGPIVRHQCIVTEALGCSIARSKAGSDTWMFPLETARSISAQLLLGLDFIHSRGVVHGDLHTNNILLRMPELHDYSLAELYQKLGEPRKCPVERLDHQQVGEEAPSYCVLPAMTFIDSEKVVNPEIAISDFGESYFTTETSSDLKSPITLLPPELFFGERLGSAVDIWTAGCSLFEILGERPLFEGVVPDQDDVIAEMISTLGPLLSQWWKRWEQRGDFFEEDGSWKLETHRMRTQSSTPLKERLYLMGRGANPTTCAIGTEEMEALEKLLRSMLTYESDSRISAKDVLKSEWVQRWALPELSGLNAREE